ncbi:MAG TPA: aldose 1-epimerase [Bryobacteraceae bacterium]|nr:aldose 1-epimerase [Bryobacteraceae bacterium]
MRRLSLALLLLPFMTQAANYSARTMVVDGIEIVRLADAARHTEIDIAPSIGNMAYAWRVNGKNLLWFPFESPAGLKDNPTLCGIPFLEPWANRIDGDAYWANGKHYLLNPELGNLRRDNHKKPIHGLLNFSPHWKVVSADADEGSAHLTSRIEFWKHPEMMAQFPFAHTVTVTYRLHDGSLEVETTLQNQSTEPMPVAIGFHPYFQLHDAPRDHWKVHIAARSQLVLNNFLIPTGESHPVEFTDPHSLHDAQLDNVFTDLVRGTDGRAQFWVQGSKEKITVTYGPKYPVAVVYAPATRDFICFEPMAAITDAFNLAHDGIYKDLQSIPPGSEWKESFWVTPSGF